MITRTTTAMITCTAPAATTSIDVFDGCLTLWV